MSTTAPAEQTADSAVELQIGGMTCASCTGRIEQVVRRIPGVHSVQVQLLLEQATIEHDPSAVVGVADDLVAGDEREADEMFEVARRMAVDRRQVRTADTGEPGIDADPVRGREFGGVVVDQ